LTKPNVDATMKALGDAIKMVLAKIGDFLDLFDLSFIVSGALGFSALWLWMTLAKVPLPPKQHGALPIILLLFASYITGMVFFAAGRSARRIIGLIARFGKRKNTGKGEKAGAKGSRFDQFLVEVLKGHGLLNEAPFQEYFLRTDCRGIWRLYIRLWAEVRQADRLSPSLILLKRYWVMAATYDGLAVALLLWLVLLLRWLIGFEGVATLPAWVLVPAILLLALLAWGCFAEAGRYTENQVEEIVASIAAERSRAYKFQQVLDHPESRSEDSEPEKKKDDDGGHRNEGEEQH
jgi:hypothetical protein